MDEIKKNNVYTAQIIGYGSDGSGICRIGGRAVFVKNAIIGETWRVKIIKAGKSAVYALGMELIVPCSERLTPECPHFAKCGGCTLMHMSYEEELRYKLGRVNDCLRRIAGLDFQIAHIHGADSISSYRNKGIYAVQGESGNVSTGFYRSRSHDMVPVDRCMIQTDLSCMLAKAVKDWMNEFGISAYDESTRRGIVRHVFTRCGFKHKNAQVCIICTEIPKHRDELIASLRAISGDLASIVLCINKSSGNTVLSGKFITIWGEETIGESLCGLEFRLSPGSFFQVNPVQAEYLYRLACSYACACDTSADPEHEGVVLDLYCGTGTISLCLARNAGHVIAAEIVQSAVKNAVDNARRNNIGNAEFICADADAAAEMLQKRRVRPYAVVVDPPRKGLEETVIKTICTMKPERIVYVSCDPATLARDIKKFHGYSVTAGEAVDMFPRCSHVECVVLLTKLH